MKKLVSIVTICALMVTIGTFSIFADTVSQPVQLPVGAQSTTSISGEKTFNIYQTPDGTISNGASVKIVASNAGGFGTDLSNQLYYWSTFTSHDNSPTYYSARLYVTPIYLQVQYLNTSDYPILLDVGTLGFSIAYNYSYNTDNGISILPYGYSITDTNNISSFYFTNNLLRIIPKDVTYTQNSTSNTYIMLPPHYEYTCSLTFNVSYYQNASAVNNSAVYTWRYPVTTTFSSATVSANSGYGAFYADLSTYPTANYHYNEQYNLHEIERDVQSILDQYSANAQNAQAVTDGTHTNEQTLSNIATNEDTWFSQNDQALTATGMDNFTYTPQVMSGLTVISDQFNKLWTAIGDWNFVYTFSMMIGLVVLILRHNPQRKTSSAGGKSNASSS